MSELLHKLEALRVQLTDTSKPIEERAKTEIPFFDWNIAFNEVFEQGGFDIVIGNPPYIRPHRVDDTSKVTLWKSYKVAQLKTDIYAFFIEKGCNLLRGNGVLSYITPKTWYSLYSFQKLRELLLDQYNIFQIGVLPEKVFSNATVETALLFVNNSHRNSDIRFVDVYEDKFISARSKDSIRADKDLNINIEETNNGAFVPLGDICPMIVGIVSGDDKKYCRYEKLTDLDKPAIRGANITKYSLKYSGEYIWYNPEEMAKDSDAKPKSTLKGGGRQCSPKKPTDFELPEKIVMQRISKKIIATLDTDQYYAHSSVVIIKPSEKVNLKFILALINSRYVDKWLKKNSSNVSINIGTVKKIPVPDVSADLQQPIIDLVDTILTKKKVDPATDTSAEERAIDELVYKLYGLTADEITLIENQ